MGALDRRHSEQGFGLVEIVVALALLGILFAAAAPLFVGALQLTAQSAVQATATELANTQLERARAAATTCPNFKTFLSTAITPTATTDARGVTYTISQTPGTAVTCPASGTSLLPYQVSITTSDPGIQPKLRIETQIWMVN